MSDRLKKLISSAVFLLFMFTQTSGYKDIFPDPSSLTEKSIVQGVGTDTGEDSPIKLTMASKVTSPSGGDGGGQEEQKSIINIERGKTFLDAVDKMQSSSDKTILLNYTDVVVVGEDAAKDNLLSHIEYLYTSPQMRMDLLIFVAKNSTAQKVFEINSIGSQTVSEKLVSMIDDVGRNTFVNRVTFYDIISKLEDVHQYSRIPAIEIIKNDTQEEKEDIRLVGYSIFRGTKLLCYLNEKQSRVLNIIDNKFERSSFVVNDANFGTVTLEAFDIKTKVTYTPDDKYGSFTLDVIVRSNFAEQFGQTNSKSSPYNPESIGKLELTLSDEIKKQITDLINYSKQLNNDIAELSSTVENKYPDLWDELEPKWTKIFKDIPVTVNVKSNIVNFFTIHDQIGVEN